MHQAFKEKAHKMNQNFKTAICFYLFSLFMYFGARRCWGLNQGSVYTQHTLCHALLHSQNHVKMYMTTEEEELIYFLSPAPSLKPFL